MNTSHYATAPEFGPVLVAMENNRAAVEAMGHLLSAAMDEGTSMTNISHGIFEIMMMIKEDLAATEASVRELARVPSAQPSAKVDPAHPDYEAVIASNAALRDEMHALRTDKDALRRELLEEGLDEIAEAANVEPEAVQRVIAQLVARSTDDAPRTAKRVQR